MPEADRDREDAANERRWTAHISSVDERWTNHMREHNQLATAVEKADQNAIQSLKVALADHHREHEVHAAAHEREHISHTREHGLNDAAVVAAASAVDKRLEGMNEFRAQLRDQAGTFASAERLDSIVSANNQRLASMAENFDRRFADSTKHIDEKYEQNRQRIENIEKGGAKIEGKQLGQGAVIAILLTGIGAVGAVLGIIITLINLASKPGVVP